MSGFVYFLPNVNGKPTRAQIETAGLGYAFEKEQYPVCTCLSGPEGMKGVCIGGAGTDSAKTGYHADKQTWRRVPKSDAWVGFYTDDPPGPKDLARDTQLPGHWVKLPDDAGAPWLCPVGRLIQHENGEILGSTCGLPRTLDCDDDGEWTMGGVLGCYAALWDAACRFGDTVTAAEDEDGNVSVKVSLADQADDAVITLKTNYYIGKVECAALGLLSNQSIDRILCALIDWPTFEEVIKKKDAAASQ